METKTNCKSCSNLISTRGQINESKGIDLGIVVAMAAAKDLAVGRNNESMPSSVGKSEVRREVRLEHADPPVPGHSSSALGDHAAHDTSPVRQGAQLHLHMLVLPEPRLGLEEVTPGGVLVPNTARV
jgi:hypothetical protein